MKSLILISFQQAELYDAMFTALVQNRADFVQLFLDNGVDLKRFLTTRTLWNLYCNVGTSVCVCVCVWGGCLTVCVCVLDSVCVCTCWVVCECVYMRA